MCPVCLATMGFYKGPNDEGHSKEGEKSDDDAHDRDT
jgi:hypothetical protein